MPPQNSRTQNCVDSIDNDNTETMTERRAEYLLALTTIFWSGTFVFTKYALVDGDALSFVLLRFLIASIAAALLWWRAVSRIDLHSLRDGTILGLLFGAGFYLQTWGLQYTTISKSAFITGMVVLFVPAADWLVRGVRVSMIHGIAVVFAAIGLLLLTHPEMSNINQGDLLTLCSSVLWAFYISYLDKSSTRHQDRMHFSEQLVFVQFASTVVLGLFLWLGVRALSGTFPTALAAMHWNWSSALVIALLYTAIFGSLASTYLQTKVQRFVPPVKAGIIFTLEPIFASAIAYFTHDERMTFQELCGASLMIASIIFADTAVSYLRRQTVELRSNEHEE